MHPLEVQEALHNMVIQVDTREQDTPAFRARVKQFGCPIERVKLDYGDYTARTVLPDGRGFSLADKVTIERKMNLDELCQCYTKGRDRFQREFQRAIKDGAKTILLVEQASWKQAFEGNYRSQLSANALTASMLAWGERYNVHNYFCTPDVTGKLIYKILYYAMKERLERGEDV